MAEFKYLVRIANTDLKGEKAVLYALKNIKGVGIAFANAACAVAGVDPLSKIGNLDETKIQLLDSIVKEPARYGLPSWLFNRRRDPETGENKHLLTGELQFAQEMDIKNMKKIRCYKGVRHAAGAPVRGQRTRSNFRKNKGKVLGVRVSAAARKGGRT